MAKLSLACVEVADHVSCGDKRSGCVHKECGTDNTIPDDTPVFPATNEADDWYDRP